MGETSASGARLSSSEVDAVAAAIGEITLGDTTSIEHGSIETLIWLAGFCQRVTVTNTTAESQVWEIRLEIPGDITTYWSTDFIIDGDEHVFTGGQWNAELDAYSSTTFGFCAAR